MMTLPNTRPCISATCAAVQSKTATQDCAMTSQVSRSSAMKNARTENTKTMYHRRRSTVVPPGELLPTGVASTAGAMRAVVTSGNESDDAIWCPALINRRLEGIYVIIHILVQKSFYRRRRSKLYSIFSLEAERFAFYLLYFTYCLAKFPLDFIWIEYIKYANTIFY